MPCQLSQGRILGVHVRSSSGLCCFFSDSLFVTVCVLIVSLFFLLLSLSGFAGPVSCTVDHMLQPQSPSVGFRTLDWHCGIQPQVKAQTLEPADNTWMPRFFLHASTASPGYPPPSKHKIDGTCEGRSERGMRSPAQVRDCRFCERSLLLPSRQTADRWVHDSVKRGYVSSRFWGIHQSGCTISLVS